MKILVLDDDLDIRLMLSKSLEKFGGHTVYLTENISEAFEKAKQIEPDLILSDFWLEDEEGDVFLQKIRLDPQTQTIPVIFITGKEAAQILPKIQALGGQGLICKPFLPHSLDSQIQEILHAS